MIKFITRRSLYGIGVLILVVLIISSIIYLAPVDPERLTFGQRADEETVKAKQKELGLDQPLYVQLAMYLNDISPISIIKDSERSREKYSYFKLIPIGQSYLVFKKPFLRESFQTGRKVSEMLWEALPLTLILAFSSIILACLIGIPLGIFAALKQNSWFDHTAVVLSVMGISLPSYVSSIILAFIFGYFLHNITGLNIQGSLIELDDLGNEQYAWKNLILPTIALGIRPIAILTQLTRSSMLDILNQDFIRTAKSKGLSRTKVVFKHALRNAMNPVVTAITGWFAALLAGAYFVENVFNYKGIGSLTVSALLNFDIPVVLGAVIITAIGFVMINIVVDILYAFLDPRISVGK